MYNQSDTIWYMTFNNNATEGIITKDIDSHTPFKHNRSLFGAPTRVRFFVTTAGAWKHSDLPAPVGATKKTSRFERMAFNASSWWVDEWLRECGLWVASGVSFRWRKLTLSFLIFRGFLLEECIAACHLHHVYICLPLTFTIPKRIHVLFKSFFRHITIAKYASSSPRYPNILGYPGHDNFLCRSASHKLVLIGSEGGDTKDLCTHLHIWWGGLLCSQTALERCGGADGQTIRLTYHFNTWHT